MISHSFLKFLDIYFKWVRFVARRRCLCAYFPRVYMLRVVAQSGCFGAVRIRQAMTFPGRTSIFHRLSTIPGLPRQAIHQTKTILPKMAEQIRHHPLQVYLKARREHRRACPQIRTKVLRVDMSIGVLLRVPSKENRLDFK